MAYSERIQLLFLKALALHALHEEAERDIANAGEVGWSVKDKQERIRKSRTIPELNALLVDEREDDWLEGYVIARSEQLVLRIAGLSKSEVNLLIQAEEG